jgi:hypothetical protein
MRRFEGGGEFWCEKLPKFYELGALEAQFGGGRK